MIVKATLAEFTGMYNALAELSGKELPALLAFDIGDNLSAVQAKMREMDKVRQRIAQKYAKKDEDGNPVSENNNFVMDDLEAASAEYNELRAKEVEVELTQISKSDFLKLETLKPAMVLALKPIISVGKRPRVVSGKASK